MSRNSNSNRPPTEEQTYERPVSEDDCILCRLRDEEDLTRDEILLAGEEGNGTFHPDQARYRLRVLFGKKIPYRALNSHLNHHTEEDES